jgi:hypothetical protein
MMMPDVPPPPADSDVNQNYLALMKSLSFIILILSEMYSKRFGLQAEGEADYDDDLQEISDITGSELSALQSQGSQASYAPFGSQASQASAVSAPFIRPGMRTPASSVRSQPVSQVASSTGQPSSRYGQERLSQYSEPRREESELASAARGPNSFTAARGPNSFISLVLNSLSKEIINAKFLAEIIPFGQLTKIQKQKLMQLMVRINKVKDVIKTGIGKPIYSNLNSVFKIIQSNLSGEGNMPITDQAGNVIRDLTSTEFLSNTASSMPPEQTGEIEALAGSGRYGKHRMLSPAMFASHQFNPRNVNANFAYNQAKRNI